MNIGSQGKNVLVTGGGNGIGLAIVRRFYADGANVTIFDKNFDGFDASKAFANAGVNTD